jgi:hypothetical protein
MQTSVLPLPGIDILRGYETLGIVGILLGVLIVFGSVVVLGLVWLGLRVTNSAKWFADKHLGELTAQSHTLIRIETKQDHIGHNQEIWNNYLMCWVPNCPIKAIAKKATNKDHETNLGVKDRAVQPHRGAESVLSTDQPADHVAPDRDCGGAHHCEHGAEVRHKEQNHPFS